MISSKSDITGNFIITRYRDIVSVSCVIRFCRLQTFTHDLVKAFQNNISLLDGLVGAPAGSPPFLRQISVIKPQTSAGRLGLSEECLKYHFATSIWKEIGNIYVGLQSSCQRAPEPAFDKYTLFLQRIHELLHGHHKKLPKLSMSRRCNRFKFLFGEAISRSPPLFFGIFHSLARIVKMTAIAPSALLVLLRKARYFKS